MKKIISAFICFSFLLTNSYASVELEPLSQVADRVFTDNPKDLEVAYFTGRCAAVFYFSSTFLKSISAREKDTQLADQMRRTGKMYVTITFHLHKKYGSSEYLAEQQLKEFISAYSRGTSLEAKTFNRNIVNDMKVCEAYSAGFSKLADAINN